MKMIEFLVKLILFIKSYILLTLDQAKKKTCLVFSSIYFDQNFLYKNNILHFPVFGSIINNESNEN